MGHFFGGSREPEFPGRRHFLRHGEAENLGPPTAVKLPEGEAEGAAADSKLGSGVTGCLSVADSRATQPAILLRSAADAACMEGRCKTNPRRRKFFKMPMHCTRCQPVQRMKTDKRFCEKLKSLVKQCKDCQDCSRSENSSTLVRSRARNIKTSSFAKSEY